MRAPALVTLAPTRRWPVRDFWKVVVIALAATLAVAAPGLLGLASFPGLSVLALAGLAVALTAFYQAPALLVIAVPGLLFSPMIAYTYAWEILLYPFGFLVLVHGIRTRAAWFTRLSMVEVVLLLYTAWGLVSLPWISDLRTYLIGARRILTGIVTLWVALRLARVSSRRYFEWGIVLAAAGLATFTLLHAAATGYTSDDLDMSRGSMTDLGWGKANFIATLLLAPFPCILEMCLHRRGPLRWAAWAGVILIGIMQVVIAARGAAVLFAIGVLVQTVRWRGRRALLTAAGGVGGLILLLASPYGIALLGRFTSVRGMGSAAIRIWYWREAWRRMVEHLPFGMGLGQGWANADKLQGIDAHEFWLSVAGDHGIPGLLLWVAVLYLLWRRASRARLVPGTSERLRALLIGMGLTYAHIGIESTFNGTQFLFIFFWLVGGSIAYFEAEAAQPAAAAASSSR